MGIFLSMAELFGFPVLYGGARLKQKIDDASEHERKRDKGKEIIRNQTLKNARKNFGTFFNDVQFKPYGNIHGRTEDYEVYVREYYDGVHLCLRVHNGYTPMSYPVIGEPLFDLTEMVRNKVCFFLSNEKAPRIKKFYDVVNIAIAVDFNRFWMEDHNYMKKETERDDENVLYYMTDWGVYNLMDGTPVFKDKIDNDIVLRKYETDEDMLFNEQKRRASVIYNLSEMERKGKLDKDLRHFKKGARDE